RWLEEYADSRLGQVIIWQLFHQLVINRGIWQREPDQAILQRTYDEDLPSICNYLEGRVPPSGWLCGELSIADVAVDLVARQLGIAEQAG
ncbi:glutathione S-transferase family protein, partial [Pseudomonas aeruginosa]